MMFSIALASLLATPGSLVSPHGEGHPALGAAHSPWHRAERAAPLTYRIAAAGALEVRVRRASPAKGADKIRFSLKDGEQTLWTTVLSKGAEKKVGSLTVGALQTATLTLETAGAKLTTHIAETGEAAVIVQLRFAPALANDPSVLRAEAGGQEALDLSAVALVPLKKLAAEGPTPPAAPQPVESVSTPEATAAPLAPTEAAAKTAASPAPQASAANQPDAPKAAASPPASGPNFFDRWRQFGGGLDASVAAGGLMTGQIAFFASADQVRREGQVGGLSFGVETGIVPLWASGKAAGAMPGMVVRDATPVTRAVSLSGFTIPLRGRASMNTPVAGRAAQLTVSAGPTVGHITARFGDNARSGMVFGGSLNARLTAPLRLGPTRGGLRAGVTLTTEVLTGSSLSSSRGLLGLTLAYGHRR